MSIGENLQTIRKKNQLSQEGLAEIHARWSNRLDNTMRMGGCREPGMAGSKRV